MAWKLKEFTGNGYEVEVSSEYVIDDVLSAHPATFYLDPNIQSKAKARELIKTLPLFVETTVSHEPLLFPEIEKELHQKTRTWEEIYLSQRMILDNEWYIDDFGFYVYCYSRVAVESSFKDLRYDDK